MAVESCFGCTLATLRRHAGLTQPQLAALAGTPVSTVIGVELGDMEPPVSLVVRLTAAIANRLRGGDE
jgi:transcriptional regulator with XRE-family HTH domain